MPTWSATKRRGVGLQNLVEAVEEHEGVSALEGSGKKRGEPRQAAAGVVVEGEEVAQRQVALVAAHVVVGREWHEDRQPASAAGTPRRSAA